MHGLLVEAAGLGPAGGTRCSLRIHGGPNGQDAHSFSFERQLFAANGYAVLAVNYRGSAAAAASFQKAIFADWGNKEVVDLLGAMDHVQKIGRRRSGSAGHRRLELRRHPDQLHDRHRHALQGGDQRRGQLAPDLDVRHRPVHRAVRPRARAAVEEPGPVDQKCPIRSSTPTASRRRRCSWAARTTSTCR